MIPVGGSLPKARTLADDPGDYMIDKRAPLRRIAQGIKHDAGTMRGVARRALALFSVAAVLAGFAVTAGPPNSAQAADARLFDPGLIISDAVFFDGGAMNASEIQGFLVSQVPNCSSSYACLSTYRQDTPTMAAETGRCSTYNGRGNESAAEIIARVGAVCGISQKALLVLLQKEQSLVTLTNPSKTRFDKATGMACPDTAPCDPAYSGFFYQVYYAAKQFKNYAANPTRWNHRAGQVNNIRLSPNADCGTSPVYIVNQATAGLYNYTPYQPNGAALNNLYGIGDGCSSYGNRNFWRIFSDWFGSPTVGTSLIKTATSASVYLISGDIKYRITSNAMLAAYSRLGAVGVVSQEFMDTYATGANAGRVIRSPGGTIYFHDAGIKLAIPTCGIVVDYGGSCDTNGYTQLTDYQANSFVTGPGLGNLFGTVEGGRYYIDKGTRREVLDDRTKDEHGLVGTYPILTEAALSGFGWGAPFVRDSVFIKDSSGDGISLYSGGSSYTLSGDVTEQIGASTRVSGALTAASLSLLPQASTGFPGMVSVGGDTIILTASAAIGWPAGLGGVTTPAVPVSADLVALYGTVQRVDVGVPVKSPRSSTVYMATATQLRPYSSWNALVATSPGQPILNIPDDLLTTAPRGETVLLPARLVKTADSNAVYMLDGIDTKRPLSSFDLSSAAGVTGYSTISAAQLGAYSATGAPVSYGYDCNGAKYVAAGGSVHLVSADLVSSYPITFAATQASTCSVLKVGVPADRFIRVSSGGIFLLSRGQKLPVSSMQRYTELGGTGSSYLDVDRGLADLIPTGSNA